VLPPGAARRSALLPTVPPEMVRLHLHPRLQPKVALFQEVYTCKCRPGHHSAPLPPGDGPPTLPLSLPGTFAARSDSSLWVRCLAPSPINHGPHVRLLASGLQVDNQLLLLNQSSMPAQRGLSPPPARFGTPPTPPCRPKAHMFPPGGKPCHSSPSEICPHLLAPPRCLNSTWEDHLPTLPFLQPRMAFYPRQGQEPEIPAQRHHSFG